MKLQNFGNLNLKARRLNAMPSMDQNIPGLHLSTYEEKMYDT